MSNTEQVQNSKDKSVIEKIGFKEFSEICDEYKAVEKATRKLLELAEKKDTPVRVRTDIYKWIIEMNIGKPKQRDEKDEEKPETIVITREFIDEPILREGLEP